MLQAAVPVAVVWALQAAALVLAVCVVLEARKAVAAALVFARALDVGPAVELE